MKYVYSLLFLIVLILSSCRHSTSEALLPDEDLAMRLLTDNPDSLAFLLEEQIVPAELSDSGRAEYGWWITRLHQQQGRNMVNDSMIHYTIQYYQEHQSPRLAYAYALGAMQINFAGEKREEANQLLLKGMHLAESRKDTALLVEIASTLGYRNLYAGNLSVSSETAKDMVFKYSASSLRQKMDVSYVLGCYYGSHGESDSMEHYMSQALQLAEELNADKRSITRNYIDCLNAFHQSEKALQLMKDLEREYPLQHLHDSIAAASTYTCIWLNLEKKDSAKVSLERLEQYCERIGDNENEKEYRTSCIYISKLLRSLYNEMVGQGLNILDIYQFCERVASVERRRVAIEQERLFVQNTLERKNLLLKITEEQSRRYLLYIIWIAGCLISILIYLYQRKLLKKERSLRQMKEQMRLHRIALSENERLIRQNEETIETLMTYQQEETGLSEQLSDRLAEIEQIKQENERLLKEKRILQEEMKQYAETFPEKNIEMEVYERMAEQNQTFNTCARQLSVQLILQQPELSCLYKGEVSHLSDIDWPLIYTLLDKVFNNYTSRLRSSFPLLTEEDIQCCCLIKLQLSTSAIARLYSIAPSSVTKRKQRIKERINQTKNGLLGKEQPVDVYLWGF